MITVTFRCEHSIEIDPDKVRSPSCPLCGERVVTNVKAPNPRFAGTVTGPLAETKHMEPARVDLAPGGSLRLPKLKDKEDD